MGAHRAAWTPRLPVRDATTPSLQSELPFRMLTRRHGVQLAYTPMLHAQMFATRPKYREATFSTCEGDRPLFVQFCANDPDTFVAAAKKVQHLCDAIDLNLGCPQGIAKRGNYGSFLMDDLDRVKALVTAAHRELDVPVTVKIRVFPEVERTVAYAKMIEEAGAQVLCVHGRTREIKGARFGLADWSQIAAVKRAVSIPVIANGNVGSYEDAEACLEATGADAVMSAECLLWNPAVFEKPQEAAAESGENAAAQPEPQAFAPRLLREYADEVDAHPVPMGQVKSHAFRMLADWLMAFPDCREVLQLRDMSTDHLRGLADELERRAAAKAAEEGVERWWPPLSYRIHPKSAGASKHSHDGKEAARAGSGNAARRRIEAMRKAQKRGKVPSAAELSAAADKAAECCAEDWGESSEEDDTLVLDLDSALDDWDAALREDAESASNLERAFEKASIDAK